MTTTTNTRLFILVTGAAGRIGSYFTKNANKQKYKLRLMVHPSNPPEEVESLKSHGEVIEAELEKVESLLKACEGVHTVFHLAGQPTAKKSGVKRVIYASSIHAISGYPIDTQVRTIDLVNPGDLYGVSKCFGEALGRYMGEQEGLSTIAIRIGSYQPYSIIKDESRSAAFMNSWLSQPDAVHLFERCIDAPLTLKFAIVHGLSRNTFNRMDINSTCELLGYDPQDNFFQAQECFKPLNITNRFPTFSLHDSQQKSGLRDKSPEQTKEN
ncbi:unnamed protein product [Rotaria sp. Silwood1]|nr:unnamed protein product [Rotaria sp. Silwood1]CAF1648323.1 unnamed protein product [Rotaria sp. Silwood1]